jgi:cell division protein FtsI (penicillin-binding protein 3)
VRSNKADFGFAITMNVKTGEILAMAQAPSYDATKPLKGQKYRNLQALTAPYEPGSVEKILTAAALIDSGTVNESTRLEIPNRLTSGPYQIKDHFEHDDDYRLNMRGVIAKSSNIGTVMLSRQMPTADLHAYLKTFGLGARTGIELPGEDIGILPGPDMQGLTRDRVAFGQGLTVTGIQEISAIAGLVNGGVYHRPTILKSATDSDGRPVALPVRDPRRIVSADTSSHIRDLMRAVVDNSGKTAALRLDGYTSGGKTGTAQRGTRTGYKGYITSYIGYAPLNDPQIMTYVVVNNPKGADPTGTQVAAPVYRDIMQYALPRYSVEPTKKSVLKPKAIDW